MKNCPNCGEPMDLWVNQKGQDEWENDPACS